MLRPHLAPQTWLEMQAEKNDDKMSGLPRQLDETSEK